MRISDWSSDVCSSDLLPGFEVILEAFLRATSGAVTKAASEFIVNLQIKLAPRLNRRQVWESFTHTCMELAQKDVSDEYRNRVLVILTQFLQEIKKPQTQGSYVSAASGNRSEEQRLSVRSEEHTSELQSLMRISYAVFCLKNKT